MIPVFIASSARFASIEWMTEFSIRENTTSDVAIHIIRPDEIGTREHGCTGFTNLRYAVPQLCREYGYEFGIYLDCDMLVLGDIAELYSYGEKRKWVCLQDGSNEVSVVSCFLQYPDKSRLCEMKKHQFNRGEDVRRIPLEWNSEDKVTPGMKLLHFTSLDSQPWFYDHPDKEAVAIYEDYRARFDNRNRPESDATSPRRRKRVKASKVRLQQQLSDM